MAGRLTVADAAVALHADWGAFQRDVQTQGVAQAQTAGQKISAALGPDKITKAFTAAGAAGGALFVGAIGGAVNFEDQLRTINTVAHLTDDQLKGVGNSILDLSKETGKSTDDLTAGFYDLVSAGVPAKDAINVLRDSAKFATGALGSTGEAVDLVTSALNAYGLQASSSTKVTDIFAQAVADGKVTAAELGTSIANIAPIASSAGISLEEVAAGYAVLTAKGVPAAQAATEMRAAIAALLTPNAQLNDLQKQTGLNFAELAKEKGLAVALDEIRKATNGDNDAFAKSLGSVEAYQFALAATGDNADSFATELSKVEEASTKGGVAQGQYTEQMKSAKRQGDVWLANLRALAIQIGGPFTAVLGPAVSVLGSMGNGLFGLFRLTTLVGGGLGALAGRVIPALIFQLRALPVLFGTLRLGLLSMIPAAIGLVTSLAPILIPIGLIAAAVAALFVVWQTNFLGIRDIVGHVVDFISQYLGFLLGPIKVVADAVGGLFGFIGDVVHNVGNAISGGGDEAVAAANDVVDKVDTTISDAGDKWGTSASDAAAKIPTGIDSAGQPTYNAAAGVAGQVPSAIDASRPAIQEAASKAMLDLAAGLRKKRSDIDAAMQQLTDDIKNRLTPVAERAKLIGELTGKQLADALHSKDPVVKAQAEATKTLIEERLKELIPANGKIGKKAQDELKAAMHSKDPAVRAQAAATKKIIEDELNAIKATKAGEDAAKRFIAAIAAWIRGPQGQAIINGAINFVQGLFGNASSGGSSSKAINGYDDGSPYIPRTQVALIHEGERVLTARENAAVMAGQAVLGVPGAASLDASQENHFNIEIHADKDVSPLAARRFGQAVADEVAEVLREQNARFTSRLRVARA